MKRLRSRKFCAALVIIAWLATLVSLWGMQDAGRTAVAGTACTPKDLEGLGLELEMAPSPDRALALLDGDQARPACPLVARPAPPLRAGMAGCLRAGMTAQVRADYLFIPAYSGLVLALFLFVRAVWIGPPYERRALGWGLLAAGLLLAAAMLLGDVVENRYLTRMIESAENGLPLQETAFARLGLAGQLKWGALAASALLLGSTWASKSRRRLVWVPRLLGLLAAALFIAGLVIPDPCFVSAGMGALAVFWFAALIHAIAVAVEVDGDTTQP